jgi:methylenetetrahydrofolate dehydrogenase (NADP+) / methenyltetrahydrofolate cyclohydrolase
MSETRLIDGKAFADNLLRDVAARVEKLKQSRKVTPGLAVVLVGSNPASEVYVRNKAKRTREAGMNSYEFKLPETVSEQELLAKIDELNRDPNVHGILVQLPLPAQLREAAVIQAINPEKDVDGFHVVNAGKLATGQDGFVPCTPQGCLMLLEDYFARHPHETWAGDGKLSGKHAVILGRSNIVGKPMAQLLLRADCTVTTAHSKTANLREMVSLADIVVAAVGKPEILKGSWLKEGAVVIDVGINRVSLPDGKTKLVGDVDFASCQGIAGAITPVPGGVGPMTIACLLANTLKSAEK